MNQILYTQDHAARAQALAASLGNTNAALINPTAFNTVRDLDTLILWGHGTDTSLCDLTAPAMVKLIGNWKKANPGLNTVEVLTCNARHHGNMQKDSYANQLKSGLKAGILSNTRNIVVKALPVNALGGVSHAWSILFAEVASKSWAYCSAPGATDELLMKVKTMMTFQTTPQGKSVSFKGDVAQRAMEIMKWSQNNPRQWSINYGYFNTLRKNLVVV